MKRRSVLMLTTLATLCFCTASAEAWVWQWDCRGPVVWNTRNITIRPSSVDFPAGSAQRAAIERARDAWNQSPATRVTLTYDYTNNDNVVTGDGVNSMVIATPAEWAAALGGNLLATTGVAFNLPWCPGWPSSRPRIVEGEVLFNPAVNFDFATNPAPPYGGPNNMTLVALHELGHFLGLAHEPDVLATMGGFYPVGGALGNGNAVAPHADDAAAVRDGYGRRRRERDLAASAMRRTTPNRSDVLVAPASASRNSLVTFPITVENRGRYNQNSVRVELRISSDRNVTTGDTFLGSLTMSLGAGVTTTRNVSAWIPNSIAAGTYHLGFIVDQPNSVNELDETNNAVALVGTTTIGGNSRPTACCTVSPSFGPEPLFANLSASCSSDPDGDPLTITWDFDDGTTGSGMTTTHLFLEGYYFVNVRATDPGGLFHVNTCFVEVACDPTNPFCGFPY